MADGKSSAESVYAALATPRRNQSIEANAAALLDYLDAVTAAGVQGLVLFGSTGEFIHFELEERMRVAGLAIKRSRIPVLVNASHSTLAGAIAVAEHALDCGAAGVLLTPPYFYAFTDVQIFEFYAQFLKRLGEGPRVYIYNLPMFVNPIGPVLAARLLATGEFAGIKDSSGNWKLFEELLKFRKLANFRLLAGNEDIYVRARKAGADGTISGIAAALPELVVALDRAVTANEEQRIGALQRRLSEFLAYVKRFPSTVAIRKAASARGWDLQHSAVPLDETTASEVINFQSWFREWLPAMLSDCREKAAVRS